MARAPGPLKRARRHLLRFERLAVFETPPEAVASWPPPPAMPGLAIRPATAADAPRFAPLLDADEALERLRAGDLAIVCEEDGRIVGCSWMTTRRILAPHYRIPVVCAPGTAYGYGIAVLPDHRRRGIGVALFRHLRLEARRRGFPRIWSHVQLANRPAVALQDSAGGVMRRRMEIVVVADRRGIVVGSRRPAPQRGRAASAGPRLVVRQARRAIVRRVRYETVHFQTAPAAAVAQGELPGFEVRRATGADVEMMRRSFPGYMARTFDHLRTGVPGPDGIRAGHRGWVVVTGGVPVGCVWATADPMVLRHLGLRAEPAPGTWYAYALHILGPWTGRLAVLRALYLAVMRDAHAAGAGAVAGDVEVGNRLHRVAVRRLGAVSRGRRASIIVAGRFAVTYAQQRGAPSLSAGTAGGRP